MYTFSEQDIAFMKRALFLAEKGRGKVSPNPMVGCVIVHHNEIIGEGYHQQYGELHAEPNAVNSVENTSLLSESTVYVTLEPCAHFGKTPPCADLMVRIKPKRVVICNEDPNPLVEGRGITKMKEAGILVETGCLHNDGRRLNIRFFTFMEKKRPYILFKWAQTADGFVARKNFDSKWISNESSRALVHQWRSEEPGIMVGTNTVLFDNPQLNVRGVEGKNPTRIIIDRFMKVPQNFHVFDHSQPTIAYNKYENDTAENIEWVKVDFDNDVLHEIMADLYNRKIMSVLVEGGSTLIESFIKANLWDEARVFVSKTEFLDGIPAPLIPKDFIFEDDIDGDQLRYYINY